MESFTCCFIGHRTVNETENLKSRLYEIIEKLIVNEKVDTFLFGSKSRFNELSREFVGKLKTVYPHIKRVYVRAEYPYIDDSYEEYLLSYYDSTYFPKKIINAGRAAYVERNCEMIRKSNFCVFYCDESCAPSSRRSGTKLALSYAKKQKKQIIMV